MPVNMHEKADGKILIMELTGKLTPADYAQFTPMVERLIGQHGKLRLLVRMCDFHGETLAALWEDTKFGWKHFADFDQLALVGDTRWEAAVATLCKPFTRAVVRYFDAAQYDDALTWVSEGIAQPV